MGNRSIPAAWQTTDPKTREDLRRIRIVLENFGKEMDDFQAGWVNNVESDSDSPIVVSNGEGPSVHLYLDNTQLEAGGSQPLNLAGLSGELVTNQPPKAHKTSHQDGGSDEISVEGLSGVLADYQIANKISETAGPTTLTVGNWDDGCALVRRGSTVVGIPLSALLTADTATSTSVTACTLNVPAGTWTIRAFCVLTSVSTTGNISVGLGVGNASNYSSYAIGGHGSLIGSGTPLGGYTTTIGGTMATYAAGANSFVWYFQGIVIATSADTIKISVSWTAGTGGKVLKGAFVTYHA